MAIVTILAIKTDIHGYCDRTGLETDIAIVTLRAIETEEPSDFQSNTKAIEYKKDLLCYLSSTSSLQGSPSP